MMPSVGCARLPCSRSLAVVYRSRPTQRHTACNASTIPNDRPTCSGAPIVVRACTPQEVPAVALICGQAFGYGNFPGIESEALDELEERYVVAVEKAVTEKLTEALVRKAEAQRQHREHRLRRQAQLLRAQLAAIQGLRAVYPGPESPQDLRMIQKWLRLRMFNCLLPAEAGTGQVMGCVSVSLMQAEAVLPPPFPSSSPLRFYVSNMAILQQHRRKGVASQLIRQCERLGRLWGYDSIWLHVSALNTGAQGLYQQAGFKVVNQGMPIAGPLRQILMKKDLPRLSQLQPYSSGRSSSSSNGSSHQVAGPGSEGSEAGDAPQVVGGGTREGVFVWQVVADSAAVQEAALEAVETCNLPSSER